jgi:hypothetical protein
MQGTNHRREQGVALLLSILCLLLLTAVAAGMMYLSATETAINGNFKSEEAAYFAARAGVEEVRDRMLLANANTINASLPTGLPSGANAGVVYVLNGVSGSNITDSTSPYFDDELCHDFTIGTWTQNTTVNQRCTSVPSGTGWYTCVPTPCTTASNSAYATSAFPLDYKWVRVTLKANNSTSYPVDGNSNDTFPVCWNGTSEVVAAGGAQPVVTQCAALKPVATPVYLVTAMAVMPNRAKRVIQQELAETPTGVLPGGLFATGGGCGPPVPLNLAGNANTGSFNSSSEPSPSNPPSNQVSAGGDVGSNGSISLGGTSTAVNGNISTNLPGTVGACPTNGVSKSGSPTYTSITGNAPVYTPPVPPLPNPLPPTTSVTYKDVSLAAGSYGNLTIKGTVTLAGGTVANPAVYSINSLTFNGGATLKITGPVVINLAGQPNVSPVLDMTGGNFSNTTYVPSDFVINYGGSGSMTVTGGTNAFAVVNAPNSAITMKGGSNFYGQIVGKTIDDQGGTNFYWDKSLVTPPPNTNPLYEISLRELSY